MSVLGHLQPKEVFRYFEEISRIPRPSYKEKAISDYLVGFAREHGLEHYQDSLGNVIIIREASEGYEDQEPVILQGHMDMVCETEPGCTKDMEKEGLDLYIDGDYVRARGTTLGGDDGIAVAYALALLDSEEIRHPRLEFVCTVCEEVGMDGAHAIDCSPLKGHLLLNIDSEEEGVVLAGCAGGGHMHISLPVRREESAGTALEILAGGLMGGHSGIEIDKGRMNATVLAGRILRTLSSQMELRLVSLTGGTKDNAIPRQTSVTIVVPEKEKAAAVIRELEKQVQQELAVADPDVKITVSDSGSLTALPLTAESTKAVISLLTALPGGVVRMSDSIPGMVQTSLNLGCASMSETELTLGLSLRSSVSSEFTELSDRVAWIADSCGAKAELSSVYPAWEYVRDSALRNRMAGIYRDLYHAEMKVETVHAGLECGLLAGKIANLDAVSIGPDILDIHTPQEHMSISSVERVWEFVQRIVEYKEEGAAV